MAGAGETLPHTSHVRADEASATATKSRREPTSTRRILSSHGASDNSDYAASVSLGPSRRWQLGAAVLALGLLAWHGYDLSVAGLSDRAGRLKAPDFLQFYTYGTLAGTSRWNSLYDERAHAEVARQRVDPAFSLSAFYPNYSPVVAWLMAPLAALPFPPAMALFSLISLAAYVCAVTLVARPTTYVRRDWLMLALAVAAWPTWFVVVRYGQLSALSLLILSGAVTCAQRGRPLLAGAMLGLLVYKPNLLVVPALVLVMTRQWRLLTGLALGAGAELGLNLALAGPAAMRDYAAVLLAIARRPELVQFFPAESHSIRGFVALLMPVPAVAGVATVGGVALATWLAVKVWRTHADWRLQWAALTTAMLVASPHLLTYDLLLLAVPLVLVVDWLRTTSSANGREQWSWALVLLYFGAWPGTFIARLYHVQISTVGMVWLLWLLAQAPREDRA
jgi:alpha-1,2-mannosyltransferase